VSVQSAPSDTDLTQAAAVTLLLVARTAPLAWLAPWLSERGGSASLRIAATLALTACLWPAAAASTATLPVTPLALLALGLREALVGLLYALALSLPLFALQWAGSLAGLFVGGERAAPPYALLYRVLAVSAFFAVGGHRVSLQLLADGLGSHPLGLLAPWSGVGAVALQSARLGADALAVALLVALPVGAAVLVAELSIALTARLASTPALAAAVIPARSMLGLLFAALALLWWLSTATDQLGRWLSSLRGFWP
jgi:type III secretory pathway component EscT